MIMNSDDDRLILISAFRYALGRATYMPRVVADEIRRQWPNLSESDRNLFKREIKEAIKAGLAGMDCDVFTWEILLNDKN